jgi:hypothetical protein
VKKKKRKKKEKKNIKWKLGTWEVLELRGNKW